MICASLLMLSPRYSSQPFRSQHSLWTIRGQQRIRINGSALPPVLFRPESKNSEVQVRSVGRCVAGAPYIAQDVAFSQQRPFFEALGITVQVGVIVAPCLRIVEL